MEHFYTIAVENTWRASRRSRVILATYLNYSECLFLNGVSERVCCVCGGEGHVGR